MKKIVIAAITIVFIMSSVSAFACGTGKAMAPTADTAEKAETMIETDA